MQTSDNYHVKQCPLTDDSCRWTYGRSCSTLLLFGRTARCEKTSWRM